MRGEFTFRSRTFAFQKKIIMNNSGYTFFFLSGFLFFRSPDFSFVNYKRKMKNRLHTLLTPYLLWNGTTFVVICLCQQLHPGFNFFLKKQVADFCWSDYLLVFWDKQLVTGHPEDPHGPLLLQFWFVQCLMIVQICVPLIWCGLRRVGVLLLLLSGVVYWLLPNLDIAGFKPEAFFFFIAGAYSQQLPKGCLQDYRLWSLCCLVTAIVGGFVPSLLMLYSLSFALLLLSVFLKPKVMIPRHLMQKWLSGASFFMFAFHIFIAGAMTNIVKTLSINWNNGTAFLVSFAIVALNVIACLSVYLALHHFAPRLCNILVGGR